MSILKKTLLLQIVIYLRITREVIMFPSGAPADACDTLTPRHPGTQPIFDKSPYYVIATDDSYNAEYFFNQKSSPIKVEIGGAPFKGFLITAIDEHTGDRIGTFAELKGTSSLPCSAITHTDNKLKKLASLLWNPPKDRKGKVIFIATVVQSFHKYYPGIVAHVTRPAMPHYTLQPKSFYPDAYMPMTLNLFQS